MLRRLSKTLTGIIQRLTTGGHPAPPSAGTGAQALPPFPEIHFIRLTNNWHETSRDPGLWGGLASNQPVFRRYTANWDGAVTMDFWYRGCPVSPTVGKIFCGLLTQPHRLSHGELCQIGEVIGPMAESLNPPALGSHYSIDSAEVGLLQSKTVLSLQWEHRKQGRRFLSIFIEGTGDGRTIHEMHYSAPRDSFNNNLSTAIATFRSIQWCAQAPPPPLSKTLHLF